MGSMDPIYIAYINTLMTRSEKDRAGFSLSREEQRMQKSG